ncbi:unnamed protein product [Periconia digitata]|uniref:Uncharacterized protein n=1 Tax=Periconia digitata TaxID=1303443 RepID=A0A9W4UQV2_9PLEO|nr:unnamed protein product [Periconia digitata]
MRIGNEVINLTLVVVQDRLEVFLVQERRALGTGENQVQVNTEAHPGPERHPAKNEVECVLYEMEQRKHHEVNEPWCEESWIGGVESFVGCEDRKQNSGGDAGWLSVIFRVKDIVVLGVEELYVTLC